jgi:hypothetical protein
MELFYSAARRACLGMPYRDLAKIRWHPSLTPAPFVRLRGDSADIARFGRTLAEQVS